MAYYAVDSILVSFMAKRSTLHSWLVAAFLVPMLNAGIASAALPGEEYLAHAGKKFALGVGLGLVEFDTNAKVTSKETGRSRFVDLEGNLGLPRTDQVNTIYGAFKFNERHSLQFGYFAVKRENRLLDFSNDFNEIILLDTTVDIIDRSKFYNLAYGYRLFQDDRSEVTLAVGLKTIDLRLGVEAEGNLTINGVTQSIAEVVETDVIAPIPLIGLNFSFAFTPKWSIATRIGLVGGSYQEVSASILETSINAHYKIKKHIGLLLGLTHFDANIDVDEDDALTEVSYSYRGAFIGVHFAL
jgi:hypothetical protein